MEFKKLALAIAISTALTACGGGGGSSSSSTPTSYSVSGTAAKGIIQLGVVTAEEYVGADWKAVGNTTTDANGKYALTLSGYTGGPLRIKITADSSTTMKCDDVSGCGDSATFGQSIALSNDFSMAAILPSVTSTSLSNVPVTPYTNMAAHLADSSLATATDKSAAVNTALSTITTMVGFNVATTPVVDITANDFSTTATADEQRAAAMSAALMNFTDESTSVNDVLANLAKALDDDGRLGENDAIPLSELTQAWTDTVSDPTIQSLLSEDAKNAITNQVSYVGEKLSDDGTYTPEPNENYGDSDVAKAKTLLTDTRSFIYNIIETDFDTPLNALDANASAAAEVFDKDSAAMASLLGTSLESMMTTLTEQEITADGQPHPVDIYSGGSKLGTLTVTPTSSSSGMNFNLSGSLKGTETNARTVTVSFTISTNLTQDELNTAKTNGTSYKLNLSGSLSDGSTSMAVSNGQAVTTLSSALTDASGDTQTSALTSIELKNLDLILKADGATFAGNAAFKLVKPDATKVSKAFTDDFPLTLKSVALKGDFTTKDSQNINASIGLDLGNSETFDLMAFLNDENTVWVYKDNAIDASAIALLKTLNGIPDTASYWNINYGYGDYAWVSAYDLSLSGQYSYFSNYHWNSSSPDYTYGGSEEYTQDAYNKQAAIYDPVATLNSVINTGYATISGSKVLSANAHLSAGSYIDENNQTIQYSYNNLYGEIQLGNYEESTSNFLKVKATAAFELNNVTGLPNAKVSAVVDRNAFKGGSASLLVNWDAKQYTFKLDNVDLDTQSGALTVTDPMGTSLILQNVSVSDASVTGALYVGTKKVADVKTLDIGAVKVTYIDGTIEIQ